MAMSVGSLCCEHCDARTGSMQCNVRCWMPLAHLATFDDEDMKNRTYSMNTPNTQDNLSPKDFNTNEFVSFNSVLFIIYN